MLMRERERENTRTAGTLRQGRKGKWEERTNHKFQEYSIYCHSHMESLCELSM